MNAWPGVKSEVRMGRLCEFYRHPGRVMLTVAATVYASEAVVMTLLLRWRLSPFLEILVDGAMLLLFLLPTFSLLIFRPLHIHIAARERSESSLRASMGRTQAILENVFDAVITIHQQGTITTLNRAAERLFGYPTGELLGKNVSSLMPPPFQGEHDEYITRYLAGEAPRIIGVGREVLGLRSDGTTFPADLAVTEMVTDEGRLFIGVMRDITLRKAAEEGLKRANEVLEQRVAERTAALEEAVQSLQAEVDERKRIQAQLHQMARTDGLTGLLNRRAFDTLLRTELSRARRYSTGLSIILLDIDHFKRINDHHGHLTGDSVLVSLAVLISMHLREHDFFARWGGEEFVILVPQSTTDSSCQLAQKLRSVVAEHSFGPVGQVTSSFGVAALEAGDSPESLVGRADQALYGAKESGRNQVRCSPRSSTERVSTPAGEPPGAISHEPASRERGAA